MPDIFCCRLASLCISVIRCSSNSLSAPPALPLSAASAQKALMSFALASASALGSSMIEVGSYLGLNDD